jgi:GntR family transcriptional regulator, transcriptional repressor for pyruvate dehydrogenase complex
MPIELSREDRLPLSVVIARRLREAIITGKLVADEELPSEKDLCEQLGVGRSTVREAIRILQAQGLVSGGDTVSTARPRVSTTLAATSAAAMMENVLRLGQVPLADLIELRVVIEGAIVAAAAAAETRDLVPAHEAIAAMHAAGDDIEGFRTADLQFHRALASASGNTAFGLVMGVLRDAISAHLGETLRKVEGAPARLRREHEAILDAVERRHAKRARQLVGEHIVDFYEASAS